MFRMPDCRALAPVALIALLLPVVAGAGDRAADSSNNIVLRAERATLSQQEGTGLYEGNAELIQGPRKMNADRIHITLENGRPVKVEATGTPVRLIDGDDLQAQAAQLVYDIEGQRIVLSKKARIVHQGRVFEGAELIYELADRRISARGDEKEGDGRILLIIPADQGGLMP
jgi:lipopolysaccharide export system protein LptA